MQFDDPKDEQPEEMDPVADLEADEDDLQGDIGNEVEADGGAQEPQELSAEEEEGIYDDDIEDDGLGYGHEDESNELQ